MSDESHETMMNKPIQRPNNIGGKRKLRPACVSAQFHQSRAFTARKRTHILAVDEGSDDNTEITPLYS